MTSSRSATARLVILWLALVAGPALAKWRCPEPSDGKMPLHALLPNGKPVQGKDHEDVLVEQLKKNLTACGFTIREIVRPVKEARQHGQVLELNPYFRERIFATPRQTILIYVGVYPFVPLEDFAGLSVAQAWQPRAMADSRDFYRMARTGQGGGSQACVLPSQGGRGHSPCTHVLRTTLACANSNGELPKDDGALGLLKVQSQIPAPGTLIGVNYERPDQPGTSAIDNFPFFGNGEGPQVQLMLKDCPVPPDEKKPCPTCAVCETCPPAKPESSSWPPAVAGLGAGAAAAYWLRRRREDEPAAAALPAAEAPVDPDGVTLRGRPDIP